MSSRSRRAELHAGPRSAAAIPRRHRLAGRATAVLNLSKLLPGDGPAPRVAEQRRATAPHPDRSLPGQHGRHSRRQVREAPREAAQLRPLHVSRVRFSGSEFEPLAPSPSSSICARSCTTSWAAMGQETDGDPGARRRAPRRAGGGLRSS